MLNLIDNLPAITILTHGIALLIGASVGLVMACILVAARGPQYRPGGRQPDGPRPEEWSTPHGVPGLDETYCKWCGKPRTVSKWYCDDCRDKIY
jgi:hypothetical protein